MSSPRNTLLTVGIIASSVLAAQTGPELDVKVFTRPLIAGRVLRVGATVRINGEPVRCPASDIRWSYEVADESGKLVASGPPRMTGQAVRGKRAPNLDPEKFIPRAMIAEIQDRLPPGNYHVVFKYQRSPVDGACVLPRGKVLPPAMTSGRVRFTVTEPAGDDLAAYQESDGAPLTGAGVDLLVLRHPRSIYAWDLLVLGIPDVDEALSEAADHRRTAVENLGCASKFKLSNKDPKYAAHDRADDVRAECLSEGEKIYRIRYESGQWMISTHPDYSDIALVKRYALHALLRLGRTEDAGRFAATAFPEDEKLLGQIARLNGSSKQ